MMQTKKVRRNFLKQSLGLAAIVFLFKPFIDGKNYIQKKIKVYKKKYTKVWILDINDN